MMSRAANLEQDLLDQRALAQLDSEYLDRLSLLNDRPLPNPPPKDSKKKKKKKQDKNAATAATAASDGEIQDLKSRLSTLRAMVDSIETAEPGPEVRRRLAELSNASSPMPENLADKSQDQVLYEMREQLRLQKELHLRRKELEELMRKDILEGLRSQAHNNNKNEDHETERDTNESKSDFSLRDSSWTTGFNDLQDYPVPARPSLPANHLRNRVAQSQIRETGGRHNSLSSLPSYRQMHAQALQGTGAAAAQVSASNNVRQFVSLQTQIDQIQSELQTLNLLQQTAAHHQQQQQASQQEAAMASIPRVKQEAREDGVKTMVLEHQHQIELLTQSMHQSFQGMMMCHREIGVLQKSVEKLAQQQQQILQQLHQQEQRQQQQRSTEAARRPQSAVERPFGLWTLPTFPSHFPSNNDLASSSLQAQQAQQLPSSSQDDDQAAWVRNANAHWMASPLDDGGVDPNPALNNQVAPGMRANNYWDNFRSFSRQNRLGSASPAVAPPFAVVPSVPSAPPSSASGAPNVAQVTPRQLQSGGPPTSSSGGIPLIQPQMEQVLGAAAVRPMPNGEERSTARLAFIEPSFGSVMGAANSPPRPRRKQKINREQNRESSSGIVASGSSTGAIPRQPLVRSGSSSTNGRLNNTSDGGLTSTSGAAAAAMVFPMPQGSSGGANRDEGHASEDGSQAVVADSLTRSIYQRICNLVCRHEADPERLAGILADLESLGSAQAPELNRNLLGRRPELEAPFGDWPSNAGPIPTSTSSSGHNGPFKLQSDKRFSSTNRQGRDNSAADMMVTFPNPGGVQQRQDDRPLPRFADDEAEGTNGGGSATGLNLIQSEMAVPKNLQRNLISRERDTRKVRGQAKPRNIVTVVGRSAAAAAATDAASNDDEQGSSTPGSGSGAGLEHPEGDCEDGEIIVNEEQPDGEFLDIQVDFAPGIAVRAAGGEPVAPALGVSIPVLPRLAANPRPEGAAINTCEMAEADQDPAGASGEAPSAGEVEHSTSPSGHDPEMLPGAAEELQGPAPAAAVVAVSPRNAAASAALTARRSEEEAANSLVEEVLNTSSESDLVEESIIRPR